MNIVLYPLPHNGFSSANIKLKFDLINELLAFYWMFWNKKIWTGGNLNQSAKCAKELAINSKISPS